MYATIVIDWNGNRARSSFFSTLEAAQAYAERMPGVIAIEAPGGAVVWSRP